VCAEGFRNEIALRLAAGALVFAALSQAGVEQASAQQTQAVSQQSSGSGPGTENNDEDFTRPENLIQTRFVYQTAPGSGTLPGTIRTVTTGTMVLRSDLKFDVAPQWTVAFRSDLPISAKNPITSDNPTGEFAEGLGDADVQAALIRTINARWAAGAGVRIIAPNGYDQPHRHPFSGLGPRNAEQADLRRRVEAKPEPGAPGGRFSRRRRE
jgi:hypothetical protein